MRRGSVTLCFACALLIVEPPQTHAQSSPAELAEAIVNAFCTRSETGFASIYPFREGRESLSMALKSNAPRRPGLATVIRSSPTTAVLLLSAVPVLANSGDATVAGRGFSGLYK